MIADIIRLTVQRVLKDKILLGLVIVAFLGLWVGGMTMGDDKPEGAKPEGAKKDTPAAATAEKPSGQDLSKTLTPTLASDFIGWWLPTAMDYNAASAQQNHQQALSWMTGDAAHTFADIYWTPQIAEAVATGQLVAGFQPTNIQAQAINPDGSVVVAVAGTMVVQAGSQPVTQQFLASFLVQQENEGLRIAGVDARSGLLPGSQAH